MFSCANLWSWSFLYRYANVRTPERHVRTRLYFTSVSCWTISYLACGDELLVLLRFTSRRFVGLIWCSFSAKCLVFSRYCLEHMQESHIHSLINVIRYCHLDDSLKGEPGLVANEGLKRIFEIKELDYLTHIVLRMYENTAVSIVSQYDPISIQVFKAH